MPAILSVAVPAVIPLQLIVYVGVVPAAMPVIAVVVMPAVYSEILNDTRVHM